MGTAEFREVGHELVDRIADFLESLPDRPITAAMTPTDVRKLIGTGKLPQQGRDASSLLAEVAPLLFNHSLHNGHPKFLGYITSSAAPIGALADLLAASVNSNLGLWDLSPIATEIEAQTVRWLAEFIGYPGGCGGVMVSGGNAANFQGFVAARKAIIPWNVREGGLYGDTRRLKAYVSRAAHTWIEKAADVCGMGANGISWIETDAAERMKIDALRERVAADTRNGYIPFLVVGTAGSVGTGAVDPLRAIAEFCKAQQLWMHVDGAYGAPAAALNESPDDLRALALADSVALDPHKWLYSPIEAACVLTRDPQALPNAFGFAPDYYRLDDAEDTGDPKIEYYEYGMQNTRGFRALKVWLSLRLAGRLGFTQSIRADIALAQRLYGVVKRHAELEAHTLNLSIVTFRYVPLDLREPTEAVADYLNALNKAILAQIQTCGELFLSNAIIQQKYLLRACIVNFRTTDADVDAVPALVAETGRRLDEELRPAHLPD